MEEEGDSRRLISGLHILSCGSNTRPVVQFLISTVRPASHMMWYAVRTYPGYAL